MLALTDFPDDFVTASDKPPAPCGAYVWWNFRGGRQPVPVVENALDNFAECLGLSFWKVGDRLEISPLSAIKVAVSNFKHTFPDRSAVVEARIVHEDAQEQEVKVCLMHKSANGSDRSARLQGKTIAEIFISFKNLHDLPVPIADAEWLPVVNAFLHDLNIERTTIGHLTIRPKFILPVLGLARAIGQKSKVALYWVSEDQAPRIHALKMFLARLGVDLHIVALRKDESTVAALAEGASLHLTDLISELEASIQKLADQKSGRGFIRQDSVQTAQEAISEIREGAALILDSLGVRLEDVTSALAKAEAHFLEITKGGAQADTTPGDAKPKRVRKPSAKAEAQDETPAPAVEPEPAQEPEAPAQDFAQSEPSPMAQEPTLEPEPAQAFAVAQEPVAVEPVAPAVEVTYPEDSTLASWSRPKCREFLQTVPGADDAAARFGSRVSQLGAGDLKRLIVMLRDGLSAD